MHKEIVAAKEVFQSHRISARVLPFDGDGRLLMMRRVKQDSEYVVSLGGGAEEGETVAAAALRECFEEAGAVVALRGVVLTVLDPPPHQSVQYFYSADLRSMNPQERTGSEFSRTDRGSYELIFLASDSPELELVQPPPLRDLLRRDWNLVQLRNHD